MDWCPNKVLNGYSESCLDFLQDEKKFNNFKKDDRYRTILEGAPRMFSNYYIQKINSHNRRDLFFDNIDKFKENDLIGNPDVYDEEGIGLISPSTLKFSFNCIDIISFIEQFTDLSKIKNIVEIGGGYGGLCLLLSNFIDFKTYTLVDLPEASELSKKYLSHFDKLDNKIKFVPCNKISSIKSNSYDLVIAVNSLSECDIETQLKYFKKFVSKSNFSYIVRNPDNQERLEHHKKTIESLSDDFLFDDTNQIEEWYSNNIIVYIKKDG